jgi:hypothetical protein
MQQMQALLQAKAFPATAALLPPPQRFLQA